ncbi:hypothetical protein GR702_20805 [Novosphingobium sp. FGD1]|uniref:Uncharacterized protein n=1 Tax=Novosphingobium silvae TaxID=2692619 RepID=A0A7X4K9F2_9SPHN|nr:E2/UBC family protein [Novosphingobium silvae]MYM00196.1 hypothetical protein [Novosphingobium silvae]
MSGAIDMQLEQLQERFVEADIQRLASGTRLVTVPKVILPVGWSQPSTVIRFLIPPGYPYAQLDCFWADCGLRLAGGGLPQNSQAMAIPEADIMGWWFSWHLNGAWDANRDTLSSWMNVILERLKEAR